MVGAAADSYTDANANGLVTHTCKGHSEGVELELEIHVKC